MGSERWLSTCPLNNGFAGRIRLMAFPAIDCILHPWAERGMKGRKSGGLTRYQACQRVRNGVAGLVSTGKRCMDREKPLVLQVVVVYFWHQV